MSLQREAQGDGGFSSRNTALIFDVIIVGGAKDRTFPPSGGLILYCSALSVCCKHSQAFPYRLTQCSSADSASSSGGFRHACLPSARLRQSRCTERGMGGEGRSQLSVQHVLSMMSMFYNLALLIELCWESCVLVLYFSLFFPQLLMRRIKEDCHSYLIKILFFLWIKSNSPSAFLTDSFSSPETPEASSSNHYPTEWLSPLSLAATYRFRGLCIHVIVERF